MSFGGWFNSTQKRVKEGLRQAVGSHQGTEDSQFEEKVRDWEARINDIKKVKESFELYLDALSTMSAAGDILCNSIMQHFDTHNSTSEYKSALLIFDKVNSDITNVVQPAIRSVIISRCIAPINAILSHVGPLYEKIAKRKTILVDFDVYRGKVHRESVANNPHLQRSKFKLEEATRELSLLQADILFRLNEFEMAVPNMLGNELTVLVSSMFYHSSSSASLIGQLLPILPQAASTMCLLSLTTASSQFLTSPALMEELAATNDLAPVEPVLARLEDLGGSTGQYGVLGLPTPLPDILEHSAQPSPVVGGSMANELTVSLSEPPSLRPFSDSKIGLSSNSTPIGGASPVLNDRFSVDLSAAAVAALSLSGTNVSPEKLHQSCPARTSSPGIPSSASVSTTTIPVIPVIPPSNAPLKPLKPIKPSKPKPISATATAPVVGIADELNSESFDGFVERTEPTRPTSVRLECAPVVEEATASFDADTSSGPVQTDSTYTSVD